NFEMGQFRNSSLRRRFWPAVALSTNPNPHRGVIPKRGYVTQRSGVPPSPKSNFAAFSGKGHEAIFEFHASPLPGGFHHGGVSLWPCSSRRQVTRHGRQPGGANASVGGSSLAIGFVPTP